MSLHNMKVFDEAEPLQNENHEKFCQEYVRLDLNNIIRNKYARKIEAYRIVFPETVTTTDGIIASRATQLLLREDVSERLRYLYELHGSSIENDVEWTKSKAEEALTAIIYDENSKDADRLKAIAELNRMRGIDKPEEKDNNETSKISDFFEMVMGGGK